MIIRMKIKIIFIAAILIMIIIFKKSTHDKLVAIIMTLELTITFMLNYNNSDQTNNINQ